MREYDIYLFDFDGTTFDTSESLFPVFLHGFEAIGKKCTPEDARMYMHHSIAQAAKMSGLTQEEIIPWSGEIIRALDYQDSLDLIKIFPETKETIIRLKNAKKRMAIVTGNVPSHCQKILKMFQLDGIFETIVGAGDYKHSKPDGEPCSIALSRLGRKNETAVYVGDSLQDIESAHNAGIDGILIDRNNEHPDFKGEKISSLLQLFSCQDGMVGL